MGFVVQEVHILSLKLKISVNRASIRHWPEYFNCSLHSINCNILGIKFNRVQGTSTKNGFIYLALSTYGYIQSGSDVDPGSDVGFILRLVFVLHLRQVPSLLLFYRTSEMFQIDYANSITVHSFINKL